MKTVIQFLLIAVALGGYGCSGDSPEETAAAARLQAEDARETAAVADARVTAADADVRAADAQVRAAGADADADAVVAATRLKAGVNPSPKAVIQRAAARSVIPAGTRLEVLLIDTLDSEASSADDRFLASLAESVVVNGVTLLQEGTELRGRVIDVKSAGRIKGRASISLELTDIVQGDRMVAITTDTFAATSDSTQSRDAKIIAGSAGVGAIVGAIAGGKKGAGIGAATGGGAGTGVVLATKGKEIHYGSETRLTFTLTRSVAM